MLLLKELREKAGITQKELANKAGINLGTLRTWEQGTSSIKLDVACELCTVLGCTPNDLCGWYVEHPESPPRCHVEQDRQFERLSYCYSLLNDESKEQLAGLASTFTADASRLAFKSREDTETELIAVNE